LPHFSIFVLRITTGFLLIKFQSSFTFFDHRSSHITMESKARIEANKRYRDKLRQRRDEDVVQCQRELYGRDWEAATKKCSKCKKATALREFGRRTGRLESELSAMLLGLPTTTQREAQKEICRCARKRTREKIKNDNRGGQRQMLWEVQDRKVDR
jgi:hypothetical protein